MPLRKEIRAEEEWGKDFVKTARQGHEQGRGPGGPAGDGGAEADTGDGKKRAVQAHQAQRHEGRGDDRGPADARAPRPALTSAPSRRAPGGHGGQPPAPARPRCRGARAEPDTVARSGGRTEGRTTTAPPPRRPGRAQRAGRGRGAAERTGSNRKRRRTGSGSGRAPRLKLA